VLIAIALFVVVAAIAAWWVTGGDGRVNVILIVVDTLRADHLGCYGYRHVQTPHIDALASGGARFGRVVPAAPVTAPSVTTILTSTYPIFHGVHDNEFFAINPALPTIASVFRDAGYRTAGFVGSVVLDRRYGFDQGFDHFDDDMSAEFVIYYKDDPYEQQHVQGAQRRAEDVTRAAVEWLENQSGRKPLFCMVHYFDPHLRYDPPPPYRDRYRNALYDGEIAYTDAQIGVLLDAIAKMGIRDNTLVVLTADHGEGLGEHGENSHGYFLYDSTVWVPLIFNLRGRVASNRVVASQVRTVDIMPTVLDLARLETPETAQGASVAGALQGAEALADRDAYMETFHTLYFYRWHELQGLRTAEWKYVRAPQPELYDLRSDPNEWVNLYEERTEDARRLESALAAMESELSRGQSAFSAYRLESKPETLEKLRTLGYVGTDVQSHGDLPKPGGDYPDPKVMMRKLNAVHEAERLLNAALEKTASGDVDGALAMVASADSLAPDNAKVFATRGVILHSKGEAAEGIRLMRKATQMEPGGEIVLETFNNLALACLRQNNYAKAADRLEAGLALADNVTGRRHAGGQMVNQVLSNLGVAYLHLGECDKAIDAMERSLEARYDQRTVVNLCLVYERCGRPDKAADRFEQFLRDSPGLDPASTTRINNKIAELRAIGRGEQ
jgi:arylsulfatase A-like enzyme/Tfp pilus assembly protein PilF